MSVGLWMLLSHEFQEELVYHVSEVGWWQCSNK